MTEADRTEDSAVAEAMLTWLRRAGAEQLGHADGRSLLAHLRGTADVVARWGQPVWLQRAALIHSIYGTDAYAPQLIGPGCRGEVAALAGERAERLAHLFCVTPRGPLLAGTLRWVRDLPARTLAGETESGAEAGGREPATAHELDALVLLHMANLADQARAADGSPGRWLVRLRDLGELLEDSDTITVPPCVTALAELTEAGEQLALRSYAQAAGATSVSRAGALALAATACPVAGEPCVW
ncbi:MAG: DUF6817 domain-containing protein, partial [Solirubrobacteraceae bacterium]